MKGKTQLVNDYSEKYGVAKKVAEEHIDNVLSVIKDAIVEDNGVKFVGLFSIEKVLRAGRDYKKPVTGEVVTKSAYKSLKLKLGSRLREEIN